MRIKFMRLLDRSVTDLFHRCGLQLPKMAEICTKTLLPTRTVTPAGLNTPFTGSGMRPVGEPPGPR
jgi:hypothetical protein